MLRRGFQLGLVGLGMLLASPSWATLLSNPPLCEFAAVPQDQVIDALAESYRGLLEFGGEALLRDAESLEEFFAPVPGRDQRSVALNESLTQLGDWVLLEAEDEGHSLEEIRERLRDVVQAHVQGIAQERGRNEEERAARADMARPVRTLDLGLTPDSNDASVFLPDSLTVLTSSPDGSISIWNPNNFSLAGSISASELFSARFSLHASSRPDEILVAYFSDVPAVDVWNWRTRSLVKRIQLNGVEDPLAYRGPRFVSPSRRYLIGDDSSSRLSILDLTTEKQLVSRHTTNSPNALIERVVWNEDESKFAMVRWFRDRHRRSLKSLEVWDASPLAKGKAAKKIAGTQFDANPNQDLVVSFSADGRQLVLQVDAKLEFFRIGQHALLPERRLSMQGNWGIFHPTWNHYLFRFGEDLIAGDLVTQAKIPSMNLISQLSYEHEAVAARVSPSGKLLAVGYKGGEVILVWNLETRRVVGRMEWSRAPWLSLQLEFSSDEQTLFARGQNSVKPSFVLFNLEGEHD